jgi:hypothetical protein
MFDGYALYQRLDYKFLYGKRALTRGVFTEIPVRGYTGWVCTVEE